MQITAKKLQLYLGLKALRMEKDLEKDPGHLPPQKGLVTPLIGSPLS